MCQTKTIVTIGFVPLAVESHSALGIDLNMHPEPFGMSSSS